MSASPPDAVHFQQDRKSVPSKGLAARRITAASIGISLLLVVPLLLAYLRYDSKLAMAQAADSFTDSFTALALLYSVRVAAQPPDADHPWGHHRAEPIGALVAAVLAGVVAIEVFREAVVALTTAAQPRVAWPLVAIFIVKVAAKAVVAVLAGRHHRRTESPALRALQVDARNDVLVGLLAVGGYFAARYDSPGWDAWLAMPVACWIAASGSMLAVENIRLLMGEAPPKDRQRAIAELAASVQGVQSVHDVSARHDGTKLDVSLHIVVDERITVRTAYNIANVVEQRLVSEPDVLHAMVHVHVEVDPGPHE
jgi:cation diffusion facilitator family transporter